MSEFVILEEIIERNSIDARWFIPFTIYRLQPLAINRVARLEVTLRNIMQEPVVVRYLDLSWTASNSGFVSPPVQEHIITEWAACGIACAVIPLYTQMKILQVAQVGDRFDYWVGDDTHEIGLEVSGTMTSDLARRQRSKIEQLRQNPYQVDGFVSVTDFQNKRSELSFHYFK